MHCSKIIRVLLLTTTALTPVWAHAQEDEPFLLDRISITATKTEEPAIDALSGSSVVSGETLDTFEPDSVGEIFRGVPGVETQSDGNDPATAINIRGLQDFGRVNVLIEGARQDFQRSGHGADGIFYLEPELIKQVDITRGPVSTIFGSGAIGGVVNFELIDASDILNPDERMGGVLKVGYDTNDEGFLISGIAAAQEENFDILGNLVWREDNDYSDGNGRELQDTGEEIATGLVKANFRPSEGHEFTAIASYQDNSYQTSDTDFSAGFLRETETTASNLIGKWNFESPDNPLINLSASVYYTNTETEQTQLEASMSVPAGNVRTFEIDTVGFDVYNTSNFSTGEFEHQLTIGIDGFEDRVSTNDPLGTGDEFTPSGERMVYGGFIQNQINYQDWLEIIGAVRFDSFDLEGDGLSIDGTNVAPKITVGVTPFEGLQIFGTYAEGFRAPAITEVFNNGTHDPAFPFTFLPNPNLRPETAMNYEVGANLKFDSVFHDGDRFRAKAVYFDNTVEDFIEGDVRGTNPFTCFVAPTFFPFPAPTGCGVFQYINIAEAEIDGFELEASYEYDNFFSTLAYSRVRGSDAITGEPLMSIRPDSFSATAGFRLMDEQLTLGGRLTAVAQQDRIPAGGIAGLQGNSYELVDLFASYEPNETSRYSIVLNNITDEQYTRYLDVNASEGFSATFTATFKVGG
ncbi:MAG: TonB-dependent hemoglobin/transferrin/lactoferrin family receptor [Pseudomonadota bacterium]